MQLTEQQENAVREWAAAGMDLGDIQKKLAEDFDVNITYMETRFLVSDLEVSLKDKEREDDKLTTESSDDLDEAEAGADEAFGGEDDFGEDGFGDEEESSGSVSVTMDQIAKPQMLISGTVTFSDGKTGQWYVDANQQLGMIPPSPDYQPSASDIMAFQQELRNLVERGF